MDTNVTLTGTVPAGHALLGRVINIGGEAVDDRQALIGVRHLPIDRPVGADAPGVAGQELLETGIKVIDLYAPIPRGGTITMIAGVGVGKTVVTTEIVQHLASRQGGCAVMAALEDPSFSNREFMAEMRSSGVDRNMAIVMGQRSDSLEARQNVGLMGLTLAEYFCDQGRETLLFLDENALSEAAIERFQARRRRGASAALTVLVWQYETPAEGKNPLLSRLLRDRDGRLVFSRALAKQSIWPAIDSLASASRLLDERFVGAEHTRVARAAQDLLRRYGDADIGGAAGDDPRLQARARRVLLFQAQPFVVAEAFTGVPGEYVALDETIRGFGELVDGKHDDVPEEAFRFVGTLDQALAKAAV